MILIVRAQLMVTIADVFRKIMNQQLWMNLTLCHQLQKYLRIHFIAYSLIAQFHNWMQYGLGVSLLLGLNHMLRWNGYPLLKGNPPPQKKIAMWDCASSELLSINCMWLTRKIVILCVLHTHALRALSARTRWTIEHFLKCCWEPCAQ